MRFVPLSEIEGPTYRFVPLEAPASPPATLPAAGTMAGFEPVEAVTPVTPPAPVEEGPILPPQASLASLGRRVAEPAEPLRSPEETVTPMTAQPAPEPVKPAEPTPYRSRAEALDDAVNLLEEGADKNQVIEGFKKLGIEWPEIVSHGQKRNSDLFRPRTTEPGQLPEPRGEMRKIEPTFLESTANTFKRADANLKDLSTSLLFSTGALSPDDAAQLIRRQARQRGAAAPSEEIQQGLEAIGGAKTYGDAAEAMLRNPRATLSLLVDSLLVTAPALAATALAGPARPAAAFAASASMEYAAVMGDVLQDKGIELTDASKVAGALQNPEILAEMKEKGAKRGLIIGTFDAISMGMAGRFLRPANELIAAGKLSGAAAKKATIAAWSKELALQMGTGAGGEFAAQQATGENKPAEVLLEGIAEGVTAPIDVAAALRQARSSTREAQIARAIEEGVEDTDFTREGIRREGAAAAAGIRPTTIAELARTLPVAPPGGPGEPSVGAATPPSDRAEPSLGAGPATAAAAEPQMVTAPTVAPGRAEPRLGPPSTPPPSPPSPPSEPPMPPTPAPVTPVTRPVAAIPGMPTGEEVEELEATPVTPAAKPPDEPAAPATPVAAFTTAKGSTYEVTPEGQTIRTKRSAGKGQGETYPPHTALYVQPGDHMEILSDLQGGMGGNAVRLGYVANNKFVPIQTIADLPEDAQPTVGVFNRKTGAVVNLYKADTTPAEGLHPVEKLYTPDGQSSTHIGNQIVSVQRVTPVTLTEEVTKPVTEVTPEVTPVTPTFTPTQAAARLPETPTVAPIAKPKEFEPATVDLEADGMPTVEVPLTQLKLSEDVPQFKIGATAEGIVEPLGGKFERTGVAPIQVWRRLDGSLEVISGRHRFDLAKRSGETTIPAQIHDEAKGFNKLQASILDAELNIRDGQGKVKDYVNYFKESGITKQDADARGLLARATGKRSYAIATQGSDELIAAVRADQIGDEAAFYIALNAPNDARIQNVGIKAVMDGKSANIATNMMQAVKALAGETDTTLDMFGYDDSAIRELEEMAKIASQKQREIQTRLSAISGAAKNPALAKAEGIDVRDPEAIKRRIEELTQRQAAWKNWSSSPDLVAEIRAARGVAPPAPTVVEEPPAGPSLFDQVEDKIDTPAEEAAQIEDKTVRDKLKRIADNLGVRVFETSDSPSSNAEGYVNIPPEDKLVEGAQSADHVFAHELGHAVMQKRGMSYNRMPLKEVEKWIPGFAKLKDISKAYRPEMWKNPVPRMRRHANKPDEIIADALGAFFLGQASRADIAPLIDGLKLNDFELGIKKFGRRAAEDKMLAELRAEQEAKDLLTAPTPEDIRAKEEAAAKRAQEAAEAERKAKADEARGDFVLTGSERAADEAAARGQLELGAQPEPGTTVDENDPGFRGASDEEVKDVADAFKSAAERQDADKVTRVLDAPNKGEIVRIENKAKIFVKDAGYLTVAQAKQRIAEWKNNAQSQGEDRRNSEKIVLSLFDMTGEWSKPWEEAGYQVYRFDIQTDPEFGDVNKFSSEFFNDMYGAFEGQDVYAILAACPCTDFASSGARHFAAKDADGRTVESVELVQQTLATIEYFKPSVWAIENPVGRIEKLTSLPPWRMSFNPNHFGDPYTKKTLLWGRFNADLPIAPVEPTEGSKMHRMYGGKSQETKNARSVTPEGFAYAFFQANNAIDNPVMAIANKYDMMDPGVFREALAAGMSENQISDIVDDPYYFYQDYRAANKALMDAVAGSGAEPAKQLPASFGKDPSELTAAESAKEIAFIRSEINRLTKEYRAIDDEVREAEIDREIAPLQQRLVQLSGQKPRPPKVKRQEVGSDTVVNNQAPPADLPADNRLVLMPCCAKKGAKAAPAMELYKGVFFQSFASNVKPGAQPNVIILSAKHGFIDPTQEIEPYDQVMTPTRAKEMLSNLGAELAKVTWPANIQDVLIVGGKEYQQVMRAAVADLVNAGRIPSTASINVTSGGIGEQRQQLNNYLQAIPSEEPAAPAMGAAVMGERMMNAATRFRKAAMNQFKLTQEQADAAMGKLIKEKVLTLDPVTGQFELKDGRFWDREVMLRAAEAQQGVKLMNIPEKKKLPPGRSPELAEAAQQLQRGEITAQKFDELVNRYRPIPVYFAPLQPATSEQVYNALDSVKRDKIDPKIPAGYPVGLRLDIPAFNRAGVFVVSIHEKRTPSSPGKVIGYSSAASIKNVTFGLGNQREALKIAAGSAKDAIQTMEGTFVPITADQAYQMADDAILSGDWVQVGFDPTRHAYFFDRSSTMPVVAADEVIQIGNMILAKGVTYGRKEDFLYDVTGRPAAPEPSLMTREGELIVGREAVREYQIKEYAALRKKLAGVAKKVAEGEVDIDVQRNTTEMMQKSRELQSAIKSSKPRVDTPEAFLAKALQEYDKGNIDKDVLDVIQAAYNKQPELLDGLLLSVRKTEGEAAGSFDPMRRVVYLYKSTSGTYEPRTIRHELSHSLEQMMTPEQRVVVVQAWGKALARAIKQNPDELHQRYFDAILKFLDNPSQRTMNNAQMLLPSYEMYQFINPSEYWAVNAERLMASQLGTAWDRFKRAVQQLFEGLKKVLGFDNQYDVHRVFSKVMKGSKERITRETVVDIVMSSVGDGSQFVTLNNIEPAKNLKEKYNRPNTPMLDTTPITTFVTKQFKNGKEYFKEAAANPSMVGNDVINGLIAMRNQNIWYGSGLEARDFAQYNGALKTSNGFATASVALDNAIRGGNIGTEVIFRGGIEFNEKARNFVAVERDMGMRGVYEAEKALKDRIGDQLGTDTIQGYLEAKRSISIMTELYTREAALDAAKARRDLLQSMGAEPDEVAMAKEAVEQAEQEVASIKKAASSVNMSEEEMYEFAALEEEYPELRTIMDNWTAINQNLLKFWRQVGLLSQGRYETLAAIKDYVPWYRIMDDEKDLHDQSEIQSTTRTMTNIGREKLFKRGRPIAVVDFRATQGQTDFKIQPSSVVQVEVNGKQVDPSLVTTTPEGDVRLDLELNENDLVVFKTNREIQNIIDNMTRNVMRMTMNGLRQFAANRIVLEYATRNEKGKVMTYPSVDRPKGRFNWIVNGKKVVVEISDPLVAEAIYGMDNINLRMWAPLAAVANLTRRSITLSGAFQIKQVFKDAPTAALVTGVKNPLALIGGVWKGFLTSLTNTDPVVDILKAAGIGGFHSPARTPEAEIKRRLGIMNGNVFDFVIKGLDHIGDSSDMAQRVATYKRVLKETGDETQALYQAANVINFLHHGSAGYAQAMVKVVPFMGAYLNSSDVLIRALAGSGLKGVSRKKALLRLGVTTGLLTGATLLYCMLAGADPEYDELDDQTKLRNVMIPGTKIMMPMNTSAAFIFKAIPELIYNTVTREGTENELDRRRVRKALADAARDMLLGPEPVPAGVKPVLEVLLDRNFYTGRTVIPEGLKDVAAAEQYTASTSELGKALSALMSIPGTDDKRMLSPIEADHLVRGIFGSAGAMAQWASNSIGVIAETRPEPTARETPVIGGFLREDIPRGREDLFYDFKKEVFEKYKTWNKMIDREDFDAADAYLDKHGDIVGMYQYINRTEDELSDINKEIRRVGESRSKDLSPKERRQEIDELRRIKLDILEPVKELRREIFR